MARFKRYTEEQLKIAIINSTSIRQVLIAIGLVPVGGNYTFINSYIKENNIDISHMNGQGWNKGHEYQPKRPIIEYLSNKYSISSHKLRLRLLSEKIMTYKCSNCNLSTWLDNPIPLELDHIDGNHENNNLENLRLLCPNCHALTLTHAGKNIKIKRNKKLVGEERVELSLRRRSS